MDRQDVIVGNEFDRLMTELATVRSGASAAGAQRLAELGKEFLPAETSIEHAELLRILVHPEADRLGIRNLVRKAEPEKPHERQRSWITNSAWSSESL